MCTNPNRKEINSEHCETIQIDRYYAFLKEGFGRQRGPQGCTSSKTEKNKLRTVQQIQSEKKSIKDIYKNPHQIEIS